MAFIYRAFEETITEAAFTPAGIIPRGRFVRMGKRINGGFARAWSRPPRLLAKLRMRCLKDMTTDEILTEIVRQCVERLVQAQAHMLMSISPARQMMTPTTLFQLSAS